MAPIGLLTLILHVLKLFVSLISVQKIIKLNEYQIIFNDVDAFLCNKDHRRKIGQSTPMSTRREADFKVTTVTSTSAKEKIILQLRRLGHLSFLLKKYVSSIS